MKTSTTLPLAVLATLSAASPITSTTPPTATTTTSVPTPPGTSTDDGSFIIYTLNPSGIAAPLTTMTRTPTTMVINDPAKAVTVAESMAFQEQGAVLSLLGSLGLHGYDAGGIVQTRGGGGGVVLHASTAGPAAPATTTTITPSRLDLGAQITIMESMVGYMETATSTSTSADDGGFIIYTANTSGAQAPVPVTTITTPPIPTFSSIYDPHAVVTAFEAMASQQKQALEAVDAVIESIALHGYNHGHMEPTKGGVVLYPASRASVAPTSIGSVIVY